MTKRKITFSPFNLGRSSGENREKWSVYTLRIILQNRISVCQLFWAEYYEVEAEGLVIFSPVVRLCTICLVHIHTRIIQVADNSMKLVWMILWYCSLGVTAHRHQTPIERSKVYIGPVRNSTTDAMPRLLRIIEQTPIVSLRCAYLAKYGPISCVTTVSVT